MRVRTDTPVSFISRTTGAGPRLATRLALTSGQRAAPPPTGGVACLAENTLGTRAITATMWHGTDTDLRPAKNPHQYGHLKGHHVSLISNRRSLVALVAALCAIGVGGVAALSSAAGEAPQATDPLSSRVPDPREFTEVGDGTAPSGESFRVLAAEGPGGLCVIVETRGSSMLCIPPEDAMPEGAVISGLAQLGDDLFLLAPGHESTRVTVQPTDTEGNPQAPPVEARKYSLGGSTFDLAVSMLPAQKALPRSRQGLPGAPYVTAEETDGGGQVVARELFGGPPPDTGESEPSEGH